MKPKHLFVLAFVVLVAGMIVILLYPDQVARGKVDGFRYTLYRPGDGGIRVTLTNEDTSAEDIEADSGMNIRSYTIRSVKSPSVPHHSLVFYPDKPTRSFGWNGDVMPSGEAMKRAAERLEMVMADARKPGTGKD